ncbi:MAG: hypothetical protein D6738_13210 [Acidobacteria bacterium]|nr:MAG: hypothetical protein D6738_13210 [Acidobacteriota bacterium]
MSVPLRIRSLLRTALLATSVSILTWGAVWAALVFVPPPDRGLVVVRATERDYAQIAEEGELRVAVVPDEINWEIYRGQPEGLVRELLSELVRGSGIELEIIPVRSEAAAARAVARGEVDLLATSGSGPRPPATEIAWTAPLDEEHPVVVGRDAGRIRRLEDLDGATVAVRRFSALEQAAMDWKRRLGGRLTIQRLPSTLTDRDLALGAARGTWPLVVLDERRARLEASVYRALQVSPPLMPALPVRWAVRPTSPVLREAVSEFIVQSRRQGLVAELERRYLENPERVRSRRRPRFRAAGDTLSPWDPLFRLAGYAHGFDWRLLAALSFAESGYDPWEVSPAGAVGLLQLMPETAATWGADDPFDPGQNVDAGARHLRWIYDLYGDVPDPDRLAFALAAYNMGIGHLADARALAAQRGLDPNRWKGHVAEVLPLLENPSIYGSLPHGMARGTVTRRYVEHVLSLYRRFTAADTHARAVIPARGS